MCPRPQRSDQEFNSPGEILERLGFAVCLLCFAGGLLLTLAGVIAVRLPLILAGGAALTSAWAMRAWLRRRGAFESAAAAMDTFAEAELPVETAETAELRTARLRALLCEWETAEGKRGSPGFDPWALQAVRNDIQAAIEGDPALAALFHGHRRAA